MGASQGTAVRFGENIEACVAKDGTAGTLTAISLGVDDTGRVYAPDPLVGEGKIQLKPLQSALPL